MIRPFLILDTKESPDGLMVFFRVKKTVFAEERYKTEIMESTIIVPHNEDVDQYLFNNLQKMGWI